MPVVGLEQKMVMRADLVGVDPPPPRHAEVKDQRIPAIGRDQPIFRAPPKPGDPRAGQPLAKIERHRAAQIGAPRLDPNEPPPFEDAGQPANGRFDFGQFRHYRCMAKRPHPR